MERFLELIRKGDIFLASYDIPAIGHNDKYEGRIIRDGRVLDFLLANPEIVFNELKIDETVKERDLLSIFFDTFYFRGTYSFFNEIPAGYYYNLLFVEFETKKIRKNPWPIACGFDWHGEVLVKKTPDISLFIPSPAYGGGD